ncbi:cytochrome B [Mucilaginibacter sp. RS28]|uniref:Cytochrome B n=1 Tax=Mucilaginibacter straminoryzae TaxID=2932774 RepID=A0A9X1X442_9SPHI|nr:cytochrome B [Mucilaginibacter straminoryzae]MCJ8210611.1 cytochrome B [Mucilaginibacter straminoryzae]
MAKNFIGMNAYNIVKYLHSGFRFVVIILLVLAILQSLSGWLGRRRYTEGNRKLNLFAMISAHTQLLIGLILYFLSPFVQFNSSTMKTPLTRFWTMEHITMMIIALVLITIGHSRSKKLNAPEAKHKSIAIFYIIAMILIILAIVLSPDHRPFFGITA